MRRIRPKARKKAIASVTLSRDLYDRLAGTLIEEIRLTESSIPGYTPAPDLANGHFIEESHRNMAAANRDALRDECTKLIRLLDLQDELWKAGAA